MATAKHFYVGCSILDSSDRTPLGQVIQIAYRDGTYTAFTVEFLEGGETCYRKLVTLVVHYLVVIVLIKVVTVVID